VHTEITVAVALGRLYAGAKIQQNLLAEHCHVGRR
jgi:hypothetical protein